MYATETQSKNRSAERAYLILVGGFIRKRKSLVGTMRGVNLAMRIPVILAFFLSGGGGGDWYYVNQYRTTGTEEFLGLTLTGI